MDSNFATKGKYDDAELLPLLHSLLLGLLLPTNAHTYVVDVEAEYTSVISIPMRCKKVQKKRKKIKMAKAKESPIVVRKNQ